MNQAELFLLCFGICSDNELKNKQHTNRFSVPRSAHCLSVSVFVCIATPPLWTHKAHLFSQIKYAAPADRCLHSTAFPNNRVFEGQKCFSSLNKQNRGEIFFLHIRRNEDLCYSSCSSATSNGQFRNSITNTACFLDCGRKPECP